MNLPADPADSSTARPRPHGRRREVRFPVNEECSLHVLNPFSDTRRKVRLLDVSKGGLKLRLPQSLDPGAQVQVGLRDALVLGSVRYCRSAGPDFEIGIQIDDVFPRANPGGNEKLPLAQSGRG